MRSLRFLALLPLSASVCLLSGCLFYTFPHHIADRSYQPVQLKTAEFSPTTMDAKLSGKQRKLQKLDENHATVEFNLKGELADDCSKAHADGTLCQLEYAKAVIDKARTMLKTDERLNVITFLHGNQNWADESADNYPHFRQMINCLNLGEKAYYQQYKKYFKNPAPNAETKGDVLTCEGIDPPEEKNLYVGVFLGWRGNANGTILNLSERSARRISTQPALSRALYALRDETKTEDPKTTGRFVVFAHSFGGLMLEQAAIKIYGDALPLASSIGPCPDAAGTKGVMPFTDMMVSIAPAVDATPAMQLVESFQKYEIDGGSFCGSDKIAKSLYRPLMVGFLSKHDGWNFATGSTLRHTFGGESKIDQPQNFKYIPSKPSEVHEGTPRLSQVASEQAAVIPYFQNLCDLSSDPNLKEEGEDVCQREKPIMLPGTVPGNAGRAFPDGMLLPVDAAGKAPADMPLKHLYVRWDCTLPAATTSTPVNCHTGQPYDHRDDLHIWNRTPYWIAAIDTDVYSGHNGFWQTSFVHLLAEMAGTFDPLTKSQTLPNLHPEVD